MPKIKGNPKSRTSISLAEDVFTSLKELAIKHNTTNSFIIEQALRKYFEYCQEELEPLLAALQSEESPEDVAMEEDDVLDLSELSDELGSPALGALFDQLNEEFEKAVNMAKEARKKELEDDED